MTPLPVDWLLYASIPVAFLLGYFTNLGYLKIGLLMGVLGTSFALVSGFEIQGFVFSFSLAGFWIPFLFLFVEGAIFGWLGQIFRERWGE